jgi:hypothetical protein
MMRRLVFLLGLEIFLVLVLAIADSQLNAMGINPRDSLKKQSKSACGTGKIYSISETIRYYHTSAVIIPEKADPLEMAYRFFELNRGYFPMKNVRRELVMAEKEADRLKFKQVYKKVSVDAGATVWFDSTGELDRFELTYYEIYRLSTIPRVNSATAVRIALKDLNFPPEAKVEGPEGPAIFSSQSFYGNGTGKFYLVWSLKVLILETEGPPSEWVYYVNALDGSIAHKRPERAVR